MATGSEENDALSIADRARASASDILGSPAFEPRRDEGASGQAERHFLDDRRQLRRRTVVFGVALVALALASLCIGVSRIGVVYSPADVAGCLGCWAQVNIGGLFDPSIALEARSLIDAWPMYYEVTTRVYYTVVTIMCGALLAVAGMLYQNAFRNPIAAPTMLGVSNGVSAGVVLLVTLYGSAAVYMTFERYAFSLAGGVIVLVLVMAGGKFISGKRPLNLVDLLLMGTIISSLLGTAINYFVNYVFDDASWQAYYDISNATNLDANWVAFLLLLAVALVTLAPVIALRFRFNCIAFSDADMRLLGVNPTTLRFAALLCGSVMILVAQTAMGMVSMISLVVPFIARSVYGAEFRRQLVGNVFIGAIVLLACRDLVSLIPFVGTGVPLGTIVTFVTLPAFAWVMALAQRQWNDK